MSCGFYQHAPTNAAVGPSQDAQGKTKKPLTTRATLETTRFPSISDAARMNLKTRFLLLAALLVLTASATAWTVFQRIAEGIIEQWGVRLAETQVRYDSAKLLQPVAREIALARQMADSQVLRRWAHRPNDPALYAEAKSEMESFRGNFQDKSYFVALLKSGAYFHNNARNEFADQPLRYHLKRDNPADAWFYTLIQEQRDFLLNVNPDVPLGVTKLWIDVLIRDGGQVLGVVGTGLELEDILRDVIDVSPAGISTLFVDHNGAIQLSRDRALIDYASVLKQAADKKVFDRLLDHAEDSSALRAMMVRLSANDTPPMTVLSQFVSVGGKRHLAGIAYLPELGWFEITLLDLDVLMPVSSLNVAALAFGAALLLTLAIVHLSLGRLVFHPISALEKAILQVRDGKPGPVALPAGKGEIGSLIKHFEAMADAVRSNRADLENRVRERTEALSRLARIDELTGLTNRRGMAELIAEQISRGGRQHTAFGIIWIDLDHFKEINDEQGHAAGDDALKAVAQLLRAQLRPYDGAARWGGDEFLVLLTPCDQTTLAALSERIRAEAERSLQLREGRRLTLSVGAHLAQPGESAEAVLLHADQALYRAKADGRNKVELSN